MHTKMDLKIYEFHTHQSPKDKFFSPKDMVGNKPVFFK